MATLKYYDGSDWQYAAIGKIGPTGPTGPTGVAVGLPTGGATGASLIKSSSTDYATEWSSNVGGLVHIVTTSFSAVASQSFNDIFSSNFTNYKVILRNIVNASTQSNLTFKLRASGSDTSTDYLYAIRILEQSGSNSVITANTAQTSARLTDSRTTQGVHMFLDFYNPFAANITHINGMGTGFVVTAAAQTVNQTIQNSTTSFDGFSLISASGNISGAISVYGYKD